MKKDQTLPKLHDLRKGLDKIIASFPIDGPPASGWQPIETAPKDGTHILACCALRDDGTPMDHSDGLDIFIHNIAWWGGEGDESDGCWTVYNNLICEQRPFFNPTHWMPLPAPPPVS